MKYLQMMLLLLILTTASYASISDSNNLANNGLLSSGEYGSNVKVKDDSILIVDGGGANNIDTFDISHLEVLSTSQPLIDYYSGVYAIHASDSSTVTFSGGANNFIKVAKDATALINGGQINYIQSNQYASVKDTVIIECCKGWSWLYDGEDITGITGQWYKHSNDEFTINFLNADRPLIPDTWTHVKVITPEPTSMLMLGLGSLLLKRRIK